MSCLTLFMTVLLLVLANSETDVEDIKSYFGGYHIYFHDSYDLLIALDEDNCYFVPTPDSKENSLVDDPRYLVSSLEMTEDRLINIITSNRPGDVIAKSLREVRSKYRDLLADYMCMDKNIFEINLFHVDAIGTTSPPATSARSTPPLSGICIGRDSGLYDDPRDCHMYIQCSNGMTYEMHCANGTGFHESAGLCVSVDDLPNCD